MRDDSVRTSRRKILKTVGMIGTAGVVTLAGCSGGGDGGGDGGGTATQGGNWPDLSGKEVHFVTESSKDAAKKLVNEIGSGFEDATGATVRTEFVGLGSGTKRVSQLVQAGDPPEVYQGVQFDTGTFKTAGILEPITGLAERAASKLGKPQETLRMVIDGEDWMLPGWSYHTTWYYRDDTANVVPDTWDKLYEYAQKADGKEGINGTYVPAGVGGQQGYALVSWMTAIGGQVMKWEDDKMTVAYDSGENRKKMIDVLNYRKKLHEYSPAASQPSYEAWSGAIAKNASYSTSYPGLRPILKVWRNEHPKASKVKPIPGGGAPNRSGEDPPASCGVVGYMVFQGTNVDAGKTFLKYMYDNHYMDLTTTLNPGHYTPVYPEIKGTDKYWNAVSSVFDKRGWNITRETIETYQDTELLPRVAETSPPNPYPGASYNATPLFKLGSDVILKDMDPAAAIDKYAPEHQSVVDDAQSK